MPKPLPILVVVQIVAAGNGQVWLDRGIGEYNTGRFPNAVSSLSMAVREDPDSDMAHYYLANSLLRIGHTQRSMQEYKAAFMTSRSEEMSENCRRVLQAYRQPIPAVHRETLGVHMVRQQLPAVTSDSVKHLNEMANQRNGGRGREVDSHPGGPAVFDNGLGDQGQLKLDWDAWIDNFRMAFNAHLNKEVNVRGLRQKSGRSKMVFSVDSSHRLRGRIVESNCGEIFDESLLVTTRKMDGWRDLAFPRASAIPGFNFSMNWNYGEPRPDTQTSVAADLRRTTASLRVPQGLRGVQGRLGSHGVSGTLASQNVSGTLGNGKVSGTLGNGKVSGTLGSGNVGAGLSAGQAAGMPLPTFSTEVSGLLLPRKKPVELKAVPQALPGLPKEGKDRK